MRTRSNYGIIGPQITSDSLLAGGVFQADDQRILKSVDQWVNLNFPSTYNSLINTFLGTKIFVDSSLGNDFNTGLSSSFPYATMNKAMTVRNTLTTSNVMIIVNPGTYAMTTSSNALASYILNDINSYSTVVVCSPGKVIFTWNAGAARDASIVNFQSYGSAVYGAIFKRDNNGKTASYPTALCNSQSVNQLGPMYNCVFQETNANGNWSIVYNNSNTVTGTINYCTFAINEAGIGDYSSGANQVFNNCLYNWTYTSTSSTQNNPVILSGHDLSFTTYSSPNAAGSGVYYGTYAWPAS